MSYFVNFTVQVESVTFTVHNRHIVFFVVVFFLLFPNILKVFFGNVKLGLSFICKKEVHKVIALLHGWNKLWL